MDISFSNAEANKEGKESFCAYNGRMRNVYLYSSLSNQLEEFKPLQEGKVSFYVCGPTVYNSPHIGNFRPVIVFDTWRRLFLSLGYKVTFVSNYTDVDDKIINRAKELGISEKELTESVIEEFRRLTDEVGSMQPDITPKPTQYMDQMIHYIDDLVKSGAAYVNNGDVYFKVDSVPDYGVLSGNTIDKLIAGSRIEVNSQKLSPIDFALWKKTDEGIKWATPFGEGRPGWHTECCVMISSIFKETGGYIDIHGGGFDLKFPHHENEIAQAKAHDHHGLAKYWLHNGFINIDNEKMSKSLGNVLLAKDIIAKYGGMPLRIMMLLAHYRAPLSFTEKTISEAETLYSRITTAMKQAGVLLQMEGKELDSLTGEDQDAFFDAMCDDLNTPNAFAVLLAEIKKLNQLLRVRPVDVEAVGKTYANIRDYLFVLGIRVDIPVLSEEDKEVYGRYLKAKAEKDFATSDALRGTLLEKGIL